MIHIFDTAAKVVFFPVRWANSVTTWIQNIRSPDDSIKVSNTCSPKEGSSLSLSLNMSKIYDGVKAYFKDAWVTPERLREVLDDSCDHNSIEMNDGQMRVSEEWVKKVAGGGGSTVLSPLTVDVVTKASGTSVVIDYLRVYLPTNSLVVHGAAHSFSTTTAGGTTGYVTSLGDGWYRINGITSGNLYVVDNTTTSGTSTVTRRLKFATAAAAGKYSSKVATIDATTFAVTQYGAPLLGNINPLDAPPQEPTKTANHNLKVWDATTGSDDASKMTTSYLPDGQSWERGVTKTLNDDGSAKNGEFCGVRLMLVTRILRQGDEDVFYWRYGHFDKNGCLFKVEAESPNCFVEKNSQY